MYRYLTIAVISLFLLSFPASAQENISQFEAQLYLLNQTPASRNPQFQNWQQMMSMKVLSSNRQLIGQVEDVQVDESGALVKVVSHLTMLGREERVVENEAHEVVFHEPINSFEIPLVFAGTPDVSPEALAAIAPAAGGGQILSVRAMKGAEVRTDGGRWVGVVEDVVFDEQAQAIQGLVLADVPGARRATQIAIPYNTGEIDVISDYGRIEFRLDPAAAQTVTEFVRDRR